MPSSIRRIDVAGRDVTEYMQLLLRKSGYVFHTSAEKEVVRMIKEKVSYVAYDPKKEEKEWAGSAGKMANEKIVEYTLPDGNKIKVLFFFNTDCRRQLTIYRLVQNVSAPQRFFSILKSLVSNIQAYPK